MLFWRACPGRVIEVFDMVTVATALIMPGTPYLKGSGVDYDRVVQKIHPIRVFKLVAIAGLFTQTEFDLA